MNIFYSVNNITYDYFEKWNSEELSSYFDFLDLHYRIIKFRGEKKSKLLKKYSDSLDQSNLNKKIDAAVKRKFKNELNIIFNESINVFTS